MEDAAERVIEQLRKQVEQDAQRRSEKIKDGTFVMIGMKSNDENQNQTKAKNNIFANMEKPQQTDIFSKDRKSVNLFEIKPRNLSGLGNGGQQDAKNIFVTQQKPAVENEDSNDQKSVSQEEDCVIDQSQNVFKSEPDVKQMKYSYKSELCKKLEIPLKKFKNGTSLTREEIYATLESLPDQPSTLYLNIRANATKIIIYQAAMIKNISKPQHFMDKEDNLKFDVVKKRPTTEEETDNKLLKEIVKIQFLNVEDCQKFKKAVREYFGVEK